MAALENGGSSGRGTGAGQLCPPGRTRSPRLGKQMQAFKAMEAEVHATPDQQISLTDPDKGEPCGNQRQGNRHRRLQCADRRRCAAPNSIVAHDVTNVGHDLRDQLSNMAGQAKAVMGAEALDVLADRGYFKGEEVLACAPWALRPTSLSRSPQTRYAAGRFGKQDFIYFAEKDAYRCPADQASGPGASRRRRRE